MIRSGQEGPAGNKIRPTPRAAEQKTALESRDRRRQSDSRPLRPDTRAMPASVETLLDLHLEVLLRKITERGWTEHALRKKQPWTLSTILRILGRERPLRYADLFAILDTLDVEPGRYFHDVSLEIRHREGDPRTRA